MTSTYFFLTVFLLLGLIREKKTYLPLSNFNLSNTLPLRGILILMVIIHHIFHEFPIYIIQRETNYWGPFAVEGFFFMSGYGLMMSYQQKGEIYLKNFLSKKLYKLIIPIIIITFIFLCFKYLFEGNLNLFKTFLSTNTILPNSWFIWILLVEYLSFYICFKLNFQTPIKNVLLLVFNISLIIILHHAKFGQYWWINILCFNTGLYFAYYENTFKRYFIKKSIFFTIISILCLWLWYIHPTTRLQIIVNAFIPLILVEIIYMFDTCKIKILKTLGKYSYELYIIHGVVLYIIKQLINRI